MKNLARRIQALALAAVLTVGLVACGGGSSSSGSAGSSSGSSSSSSAATENSSSDGEKIKLGFSSAAFSDEWCKHLADAFVELSESEYPQFEVTVLDGNIDTEKQINTYQALIEQKMDYIAAQSLPGTETGLLEINNAGIPLFCVDMVPDSSNGLVWTQVGVDEKEFGRLQAAALAEVLPENGTVCIAMNTLGQNSQINRTAGFEEKIAELRPDVQIIDEQSAESKTDKAMNITEDWLQKYGEDGINAIVCQSAMAVQGVVEALRAHDLTGKIYVAAQDFTQPSGTEWLKNDETYVDVFYDYYALARGVFDTIVAHENGTELPSEVMIQPSVWTKENCDEFGK